MKRFQNTSVWNRVQKMWGSCANGAWKRGVILTHATGPLPLATPKPARQPPQAVPPAEHSPLCAAVHAALAASSQAGALQQVAEVQDAALPTQDAPLPLFRDEWAQLL